ncbi:PD-(D/E)XK nuclease family protein, partial [Candidatus Fermentibacterales bacterium]|nr:PD-(D/E)XK nuclease family protein [Candidatus Fermentibacterales bacterium]
MIGKRYDRPTQSLSIAIRDLIALGALPESLAGDDAWLDLQLRNRAHGRYQSCYCEQHEVEGEVPVYLELERSGHTLRISGRIDILDDRLEPPLVIEVKTAASLARDPDPIADHPAHVLQLAYYCRAIEAETGTRPSGRLVYL